MLKKLVISSLVLLSSATVFQVWLSSMRSAEVSDAFTASVREADGYASPRDLRRGGQALSSEPRRAAVSTANQERVALARFATPGMSAGSLGRATAGEGNWHARRIGSPLSPSQLVAAIQNELVRAGCLARKSGVWDANSRSALARATAAANATMPVGAPEPAHLSLLRGDLGIACGGREVSSSRDVGSADTRSLVQEARPLHARPEGIMGLGAGEAHRDEMPRAKNTTTSTSRALRVSRIRRGRAVPVHEQDGGVQERLRYPLGRY